MRSIITALVVLAVTCGIAAAQAVQPDDRAKIDVCLKDAGDRPESCIGTVYTPCSDTPAGGTTAGMVDCAARETAIWTEKVDANLKALRSGDLGKVEADPANRPNENRRKSKVSGAVILDDMQKTWIAWRAKKCDTMAMQAEGGTLSRVIYGSCLLGETAHHALWLKALLDDSSSR
jgi:uncharacterized protein YecT (DUF1311 family)